jgi:hypothetical protein
LSTVKSLRIDGSARKVFLHKCAVWLAALSLGLQVLYGSKSPYQFRS